jgi:hypothetical protein
MQSAISNEGIEPSCRQIFHDLTHFFHHSPNASSCFRFFDPVRQVLRRDQELEERRYIVILTAAKDLSVAYVGVRATGVFP